jgi:hypothetical protein
VRDNGLGTSVPATLRADRVVGSQRHGGLRGFPHFPLYSDSICFERASDGSRVHAGRSGTAQNPRALRNCRSGSENIVHQQNIAPARRLSLHTGTLAANRAEIPLHGHNGVAAGLANRQAGRLDRRLPSNAAVGGNEKRERALRQGMRRPAQPRGNSYPNTCVANTGSPSLVNTTAEDGLLHASPIEGSSLPVPKVYRPRPSARNAPEVHTPGCPPRQPFGEAVAAGQAAGHARKSRKKPGHTDAESNWHNAQDAPGKRARQHAQKYYVSATDGPVCGHSRSSGNQSFGTSGRQTGYYVGSTTCSVDNTPLGEELSISLEESAGQPRGEACKSIGRRGNVRGVAQKSFYPEDLAK